MERQLCRLILSLVILYYIVCTYHFRQYITFENEAQMRLQNNVLMHCKLRRRIASHQISMRLRTSSQPQVCPRPAMLHCKLSTNTSSSHTAQWLRQLVYSKNAQFFCSWVCLRSDRVLTTNIQLQGSFESVPRPPRQGGIGTLVWSAFGAHPSAIATFSSAQTNRTKREIERCNSTELNEAGVKAPLEVQIRRNSYEWSPLTLPLNLPSQKC